VAGVAAGDVLLLVTVHTPTGYQAVAAVRTATAS
jgi:hypothetical protein